MKPDDGYTTYVLGYYMLEKVGTDQAKELARSWELQRKAQKAAEEARAKQDAEAKPKNDP